MPPPMLEAGRRQFGEQLCAQPRAALDDQHVDHGKERHGAERRHEPSADRQEHVPQRRGSNGLRRRLGFPAEAGGARVGSRI